ncbi:hypothetical protein [Pseudotabrizicola sp. 4114]|uniref:hypothetical protein n=1 Tax=Pseudotabrizicola sp. 4114 TaxID=2817731 RepID=UPI00285DD1E2|nr:hypothetical protein [Pseudorhodobacter sp. 4114]
MRQGYEDILSNAELEVEYVADLVVELVTTKETRKLWRAWSGILEHYVKAVSALRRATDQGTSKGWSDSLLHQQRDDILLHYAFQSRDHANHVFEGKREASPRSVKLDDIFSISGNASVTIRGVSVVGRGGVARNLPSGVINTRDGFYAGGTIPKSSIREQKHYLVLTDVKTRSGVWSIPNPKTHPEKQAIEIAIYARDWLNAKLKEANELAAQEKRN